MKCAYSSFRFAIAVSFCVVRFIIYSSSPFGGCASALALAPAMWECDISRIDAKKRRTCEIDLVDHLRSADQQWQAYPQHIADAIQDVYENGEANGVKFLVYFWDRITRPSHVLTVSNVQTSSVEVDVANRTWRCTSDHEVYEVDVANRTQRNLRTHVVREIRRVVLT